MAPRPQAEGPGDQEARGRAGGSERDFRHLFRQVWELEDSLDARAPARIEHMLAHAPLVPQSGPRGAHGVSVNDGERAVQRRDDSGVAGRAWIPDV